jgi:hypothetical protein
VCRQSGADRSLRGIFECNGSAKKGHDPITGQLIDRASVVEDLVDEDLIDLIHDSVSLLRAELFGERGKALHIGEQNGDLFALTLNLSLLSEDLLGESSRKVALDLV